MTRRLLLSAFAAACWTAPASASAADDAGAVRAAMVYNFVRFTTWPAARFESPSAPVRLCVEPSDRLSSALRALSGKAAAGRVLEVRAVSASSWNASCHVAYVSDPSASDERLSALARRGVLVVGGGPAVLESGGHIGLIEVGRQVRFEVDDTAARRSGVGLSSKLLRLALRVR